MGYSFLVIALILQVFDFCKHITVTLLTSKIYMQCFYQDLFHLKIKETYLNITESFSSLAVYIYYYVYH
jgi:hypothetical protein